jgi:hypothetical protein
MQSSPVRLTRAGQGRKAIDCLRPASGQTLTPFPLVAVARPLQPTLTKRPRCARAFLKTDPAPRSDRDGQSGLLSIPLYRRIWSTR